jgi:hypothetical protein
VWWVWGRTTAASFAPYITLFLVLLAGRSTPRSLCFFLRAAAACSACVPTTDGGHSALTAVTALAASAGCTTPHAAPSHSLLPEPHVSSLALFGAALPRLPPSRRRQYSADIAIPALRRRTLLFPKSPRPASLCRHRLSGRCNDDVPPPALPVAESQPAPPSIPASDASGAAGRCRALTVGNLSRTGPCSTTHAPLFPWGPMTPRAFSQRAGARDGVLPHGLSPCACD